MLDNCNSAHITSMPPRLSANTTDASVNATLTGGRDGGNDGYPM
jgi:hypothetical protein